MQGQIHAHSPYRCGEQVHIEAVHDGGDVWRLPTSLDAFDWLEEDGGRQV